MTDYMYVLLIKLSTYVAFFGVATILELVFLYFLLREKKED